MHMLFWLMWSATLKQQQNFLKPYKCCTISSPTPSPMICSLRNKEIELTAQSVELKNLSDTRWACQYAVLVAIRKSLPAIRATLLDIMSQSNAWRKTEARAVSGLIDE